MPCFDAMHTFKAIAGGIALAVATAALPLQAQAADTSSASASRNTATLILLKGKGILEKKLTPLGYKVEWTEFPAGPQLLEALNVGAIDFGTTGEAPPIFAQAAGAPLVYVGARAAGAAGRGDPRAQGQPDQDGRRPEGQEGRAEQGLERSLPAGEGAGKGRRQLCRHRARRSSPPADARAAFEQGAVDAWVIWDPFQAAAEAATGARTLADGKGSSPTTSSISPSRLRRRASATWSTPCSKRSARSTPGSRTIQARWPQQLSPGDRHSRRRSSRSRSKRQAYGIKPLDADVVAEQQKHRRHLPRARPDPEADQRSPTPCGSRVRA